MLGGKVKVKLPSGKEGLLTVSPNTQVGDRRRMNGAGIQGGDLDLEFVLMETEELTDEQRDALEKLAKTDCETKCQRSTIGIINRTRALN